MLSIKYWILPGSVFFKGFAIYISLSDLRWSWISWIYQDFVWIIFYPWVFDNLYWSVALLVFFKRKLKQWTWCLKKIRTKKIFYFWRKSNLIFFLRFFVVDFRISFSVYDFSFVIVYKGKIVNAKGNLKIHYKKNPRKKKQIRFSPKIKNIFGSDFFLTSSAWFQFSFKKD